jgi:hypothetical protein
MPAAVGNNVFHTEEGCPARYVDRVVVASTDINHVVVWVFILAGNHIEDADRLKLVGVLQTDIEPCVIVVDARPVVAGFP